MRRTVAGLTAPVAAGAVFVLILFGSAISGLPSSPAIPIVLSGFAIGLFVLDWIFTARSRSKTAFSAAFHFVILFCVGAASFLASQLWVYVKDSHPAIGLRPQLFESAQVVLADDPRFIQNGAWLVNGFLEQSQNKAFSVQADGRLVIVGSCPKDGLAAGRRVVFYGSMDSINPGTDSPGYRFRSDSFRCMDWRSDYFRIRYAILSHLSTQLGALEPQTASFVSILLLGRKTEDSSYLNLVFGKAGILHLLALSGFHLGLIAAAVRLLLKRPFGKNCATVVSALFAVLFLCLVGWRASLVRAVLMYWLWALDNLRGRLSRSSYYLCVAFLLQGLIDPRSVYSLSFTLSYLALAGIIFSGPAWNALLSRKLPRRVSGPVAVGLSAQMATLVVLCHAFGVWRPVGLLSALVLSPLTAFSMCAGAIFFLLSGSNVQGAILVSTLETSVEMVVRVAEILGRFPGITVASKFFPWPIALCGTILPHIFLRRISRERSIYTEPRLPGLDPCFPGKPGNCATKTLGTKFSGEPRCQRKNSHHARTRRPVEGLGNRSRSGGDERTYHRIGSTSHSL